MRFDKLELDPAPEDRRESTPKLRDDKDHEHWFKAAVDQRRTGAYETALRFYSRALELEKTLVPAWVGQVQMLVQLHEYPQAVLWARKALEMFPNQPELLAGQAQAECRQGNLKPALALSDGALRQRGESAYRWQVRGELMLAGRERNDRHCFDKAQIADADWLTPLETALIYRHYNNFSLAMQRAQQAAEKAPGEAYVWFILGGCQAKLGLDAPACRSFERCLELRANYVEAHQQLDELRRRSLPLVGFFRRFLRG